MDISLSDDLERFVAEQVRSGRFASASEVVADALRQRMRDEDIADLREKLRRSEEDIRAGRVVVADDAFFERARAKVRSIAAEQGINLAG